jgi:hypothetical protein
VALDRKALHTPSTLDLVTRKGNAAERRQSARLDKCRAVDIARELDDEQFRESAVEHRVGALGDACLLEEAAPRAHAKLVRRLLALHECCNRVNLRTHDSRLATTSNCWAEPRATGDEVHWSARCSSAPLVSHGTPVTFAPCASKTLSMACGVWRVKSLHSTL